MSKVVSKISDRNVVALPEGLHAVGDGLYVRRRGGTTSWVYRYQLAGNRRTVVVGTFPALSLAAAKLKAAEMAVALEGGKSPRTALAVPVGPRTLGEAIEDFIQSTAPSWRSKTEEVHTRNQLQHHFGKLYSTPLGHLEQDDILRPLRKVWSQPSVAEKLLSRIRRVLIREQGLKHLDRQPIEWAAVPLIMPKVRVEVEHHAAFDWNDAPAAWKALAGRKGSAAACLRLIILCATRSGETRGALWAEINWEKATWTIPKARTKTEKPLVVPLSAQALEMLRALPRVDPVRVFYSRIGGKGISDMSVLKVQRHLHAENTVHGWRSTFRDWCSENKVDPVLAEMSLSHNVGSGVERAYARSDLTELRRPVLQAWANHVTGEVHE